MRLFTLQHPHISLVQARLRIKLSTYIKFTHNVFWSTLTGLVMIRIGCMRGFCHRENTPNVPSRWRWAWAQLSSCSFPNTNDLSLRGIHPYASITIPFRTPLLKMEYPLMTLPVREYLYPDHMQSYQLSI